MAKLTAIFEVEKQTKNTIRFSEVADGPPIVNTIYVQKWAVKELGDGNSPEKIRVTIELAE